MAEKSNKILIVEDERPLARALELKLQHEGFLTDVANNGEEALSRIQSNMYDYVLLDLVMPNMDGFQVLQEMNKLHSHPNVIVLSNLGQDDDVERAIEMGAEDFFIKSNVPIIKIVEYLKRKLK